MKLFIRILGLLFVLSVIQSCESEESISHCEENIEQIQLNEYQILGSHNSYRLKTNPQILALVTGLADALPEEHDPHSWDYSHEPLDIQLNVYNLRSFELDVYRDPYGELFYNRMGNAFVGQDIESGIEKLLDPGLKILHFPDFDYNTHFFTFKDALNFFKDWSSLNPTHLPITILIEAKEDSPDALIPDLGLTAAIPFIDQSVEEIENEIIEVFGPVNNQILYPEDVRHSYPTLKDAVLDHAWPALYFLRGKIIFVLMADDEIIEDYITGYPSLTGRTMFVFTDATKDEAAFLNLNDPVSNYQAIKDYVKQGFMVRTQSDSGTYEARSGDYSRMNDAINSGAQIICTDYYRPDSRAAFDPEWSDYHVRFSGNRIALLNQNANLDDLSGCEIVE